MKAVDIFLVFATLAAVIFLCFAGAMLYIDQHRNKLSMENKQVVNVCNEGLEDGLKEYYKQQNQELVALVNSKNYDCTLAVPKSQELPEFLQIARKVANMKPYKLDVWDCSDTSQEYLKRLEKAGYKGWQIENVKVDCDLWAEDWDKLAITSGYSYEDCKRNGLHAIVCLGGTKGLCIETGNGKIIDWADWPKKYGIT